MYIPVSTYRVQLNSSFKLSDLTNLVDYLDKLGITTIYGAPFFQARAGSVHGYDVTDPHVISPKIGTLDEFGALAEKLKEKSMGWLQDLVPNHMAFDPANPWLMDIFEKGPYSLYYNFFDINWDYPEAALKGKLLAPFLGGELGELLQKGEIQLTYSQPGFGVTYYDLTYPLAWPSYYAVLSYGRELMKARREENEEAYNQFSQLLEKFQLVKVSFHEAFDAYSFPQWKENLHQQYTTLPPVRQTVDACLQTINSQPEALKAMLDEQFFQFSHWRTTESKINYRRFFTVNDLICLRMEDDQVFDYYHQFIKTLLDNQLIQGLRIDHIDGLYQPTGYLEKLRELVGEEVYLIVEKILESEEGLPDHWPVEGTSGYEFLSDVNRLLTEEKNQDRFSEIYQHFTRTALKYEDLVFDKKLFILKEKMGGELNNLTQQVLAITPANGGQDLKEAMAVLLASFPVYRIYPTRFPFNEIDWKVVDFAFSTAERRAPHLTEALHTIRAVFTREIEQAEALNFVMRLQQFTGPLAAKGVEDTVFYLFNRFISHNEVGDSPHLFGSTVEEFHQRMRERWQKTPLSINATTTHDTKRGEDARMRINVLSELPEEWDAAVFTWKEINQKHKQQLADKVVPDDNDEYFIYQALIGGFPMEGHVDEEFSQRLKVYLIKVVREAKANSDWSEPNGEYEQGIVAFIDTILRDQAFLAAFMPFFEKVRQYGMIYSLAQILLKVTAPGIPDTYQGCELWDLSFVDPDNRRWVNFTLRQRYLAEIEERPGERVGFIRELVQHNLDGRIKMLVLSHALNGRKKEPELFTYGEYLPLAVSGDGKHHIIAFARRAQDKWALVVVPKSITAISSEDDFGIGSPVWGNMAITLPEGAPVQWKNRLTDRNYNARPVETVVSVLHDASEDAFFDVCGESSGKVNQLFLREVLEDLPVAFLIND